MCKDAVADLQRGMICSSRIKIECVQGVQELCHLEFIDIVSKTNVIEIEIEGQLYCKKHTVKNVKRIWILK